MVGGRKGHAVGREGEGKRKKDRAVQWMLPAAYRLLILWFRTCRPVLLKEDLHREFFLSQRPFIGATWHRAAIYACYYFGPFHPITLFSESPDGEYLARFAQRCGMIPVRGSSTRGGEKGLIRILRLLRQGNRICATVLDGPQGPRYQAKPGLLWIAKKTGLPVLPLIWSSNGALTLERTWDKTMIPRPFSKVVIHYGPPLQVPPTCSAEELDSFRLELENRLNTIMIEADQFCGYATRWD